MEPPDDIGRFPSDWRGWHGPIQRPPPPREPPPTLGRIGTCMWHIREYFRPKTLGERVGIALAKAQKQ